MSPSQRDCAGGAVHRLPAGVTSVAGCADPPADVLEVAAVVEGAMHLGTTMQMKGNYVDSHG